jgi:hypothetical protein
MTKQMTGGCQCGRVRYSAELENGEAYLCHCRMCQRATGGFAAAFVQVPLDGLTWEQEPDWYESSPIAHRPFCSACGTPLGFAFLEPSGKMDLTLGSFDDPAYFRPTGHSGAEAMHAAWLDTSDLPRSFSATTESVASRWKAAGLEVPE